ncbi:ERGIC and golgi 3, isoform CRA_c, partial [Mus musculus]
QCLTPTPWTPIAVRAATALSQKTSSAVTVVKMCGRPIAVEAGPSRTRTPLSSVGERASARRCRSRRMKAARCTASWRSTRWLETSTLPLGRASNSLMCMVIHDLQSFGLDNPSDCLQINMTHYIKHLSFGEDYPGIVNPLDHTNVTAPQASMMFQYFVKVVPTVYMKVDGEVLRTNQFSVTRHEKVANGLLGDQGLPGVFVLYELSPMMVKLTEKHRSFTHFLTGVCAIIGGMFTVAGLIDSLIYHSARAIQKKIDLGKTT